MSGFRGWYLRNILLPAGGRVLGGNLVGRLEMLDKAQWWSPERIIDWRNEALRKTLSVAFSEVPFYREGMLARGLKPVDFTTDRDLMKLPVVSKVHLRAGYPGEVTRETGFRTYENNTSGSTGKNFTSQIDTETAAWYRSSFLLALQWAGWSLGEKHLQTGMNLRRNLERRLKDFFFGCFYFSAYDLKDDNLDGALRTLENRKVRHLWGYPGSLAALARRAEAVGWNESLTSIVTWGDMLDAHSRQLIERVFRCRVSDTYGCAEGFQISAQCGSGMNYHVHSLDVIVEYLDDQGESVGPGEEGEIVITRLHAGPMPFIRYATGDRGVRNVDQAPCECGRGFEKMSGVQGRTADLIETPTGNRLIVHFFTGILEHFPEIDQYQVVQDAVDHLTIKVVPAAGFSPSSVERIVRALREKGIDEGMEIEVETVKSIPLEKTGKRKFVIKNY